MITLISGGPGLVASSVATLSCRRFASLLRHWQSIDEKHPWVGATDSAGSCVFISILQCELSTKKRFWLYRNYGLRFNNPGHPEIRVIMFKTTPQFSVIRFNSEEHKGARQICYLRIPLWHWRRSLENKNYRITPIFIEIYTSHVI